jgi:DegV family protein with EDD domain
VSGLATQDYVITTDSNSELPLSIAKKYDVTYVPMDYLLDDKEYFYDLGENTDFKAFFNAVRSGKLPTTSTYPPLYYVDLWQPMLESGRDVLHLGFSSMLSAAYRNLSEARDMLNDDFAAKGRRVVTIDLLSISGGAALLVYKALQMKEAGAPLEEVADWVRDNATRAQHWFMANDLYHLRRGGRLSTTTAIVGSVLNVKPILILNRDGKVIAFDKVMGRKKAANYLADKVKEYALDPENNACIILHGDCLEDAEELRRLVEVNTHFREVFVQFVGPVIGTHAGPDVLAVCFMGKERPE